MFILFQKNDEKARMWSQALHARGVRACGLDGSPIMMPVKLAGVILRHGRPSAFFFRYLNDYPGIIRTLLRAVAELSVLLICKLARIQVCWICHNVDRESVEAYPRITRFRRRVLAASAQKIYVMDALLIPHAQKILHRWSDRLDFLTFGEPEPRVLSPRDREQNARVLEFCSACRSAVRPGRRVLIGLCVGNVEGAKYAHFEAVPALIAAASDLGVDLFMVVAGDLERSSAVSRSLLGKLESHPNVLFFPSEFVVDERKLAGQIDFLWRGYRDLSVAYTLYVGAAARLPVLALSMGFVGEAVEFYGLGATVKSDFSDLGAALARLTRWNSDCCTEFLATHSWEIAADRILANLKRESRAAKSLWEVGGS
mgnify:CR=1 FL=1|jgi:hypothetical protein